MAGGSPSGLTGLVGENRSPLDPMPLATLAGSVTVHVGLGGTAVRSMAVAPGGRDVLQLAGSSRGRTAGPVSCVPGGTKAGWSGHIPRMGGQDTPLAAHGADIRLKAPQLPRPGTTARPSLWSHHRRQPCLTLGPHGGSQSESGAAGHASLPSGCLALVTQWGKGRDTQGPAG